MPRRERDMAPVNSPIDRIDSEIPRDVSQTVIQGSQ